MGYYSERGRYGSGGSSQGWNYDSASSISQYGQHNGGHYGNGGNNSDYYGDYRSRGSDSRTVSYRAAPVEKVKPTGEAVVDAGG